MLGYQAVAVIHSPDLFVKDVAPDNIGFQRVMIGEENKIFFINPSKQKTLAHKNDLTQLRTVSLFFRSVQKDNMVNFHSYRVLVFSLSERKIIIVRSISNRSDYLPTNEILTFSVSEQQLVINTDEQKSEILVNQDKTVIIPKNLGSHAEWKENISTSTNNC